MPKQNLLAYGYEVIDAMIENIREEERENFINECEMEQEGAEVMSEKDASAILAEMY